MIPVHSISRCVYTYTTRFEGKMFKRIAFDVVYLRRARAATLKQLLSNRPKGVNINTHIESGAMIQLLYLWYDEMITCWFMNLFVFFFFVSKSKANIHVRCNQQVFVATRVFLLLRFTYLPCFLFSFDFEVRMGCYLFSRWILSESVCHIENRVQHFFFSTRKFIFVFSRIFPVVFHCHLHFGGLVGNAHA